MCHFQIGIEELLMTLEGQNVSLSLNKNISLCLDLEIWIVQKGTIDFQWP